MNKTYTFQSNSTEDTIKLASILADKLGKGTIICLDGDLGVGKTVFAQALINSLGIEGYISSPTFTIVNEYKGKYTIYHIDAYRLNTCDEIYDIGLDEYLSSNGICIIEWSKNIKEVLPREYLQVIIKKNLDKGENYREIVFNPYGAKYEDIAYSTSIIITKANVRG